MAGIENEPRPDPTNREGGDRDDSPPPEPNPRLDEVEGDEGMPGELIGGDHNLPGSQEPPPGAEPSTTPISDAKGTS